MLLEMLPLRLSPRVPEDATAPPPSIPPPPPPPCDAVAAIMASVEEVNETCDPKLLPDIAPSDLMLVKLTLLRMLWAVLGRLTRLARLPLVLTLFNSSLGRRMPAPSLPAASPPDALP